MYSELNNSRSAIDQLGRDKVRRKENHIFFNVRFFCAPFAPKSML